MNPPEYPENNEEEFEVSNIDSQQIYGLFKDDSDSNFAFEITGDSENTEENDEFIIEKNDQLRSEPQFGEIARPPQEQKPVIGAADSVFENQSPDSSDEDAEDSEVEIGEKLSLREKIAMARNVAKEEKKPGFIQNIKEKIALARMDEKEEIQETAGLDITPPSTLSALKEKILGSEEEIPETNAPGEEPGSFSQILTPLSSSEIAVLQAEVAADETIFQSIEKSRTSAHIRQQIGFLLGLILVVGFFFVQNISYLTVTLTEAKQPSWTPDVLVGDPMGAILFTLGLLLPLTVVFIMTGATRYLIEGVINKKIELLLIGALGYFVSFACLFALMDGEIILGLVFLIVYMIAAGARKVFKI